jgi:hypothetical protein
MSIVVPHQAFDFPIADLLEHDRDTVEAASVAHDNSTPIPDGSKIGTVKGS